MPNFGLHFLTSDTTSNAHHAANRSSQGSAPKRPNSAPTETYLEGDDVPLVGTTGLHTPLALSRQQSTQDVDLELPQNLDRPLSPEELERRISCGKAAVIHVFSQEMSEKGLERAVDLYADIELAGLTGLGALHALEEMALAELFAIWGGDMLSLSKTFEHEITPTGELVFRMGGEPAAEQDDWQARFDVLDEVMLRLVGTTGSAQTFMHGRRIGELRDILAGFAFNEDRRSETRSVTVGGEAPADLMEGKAEKALRILDNHIAAGFNQAALWVKVAKLEEVVLERIGFTPLKRSFTVVPVPAEVPAELSL